MSALLDKIPEERLVLVRPMRSEELERIVGELYDQAEVTFQARLTRDEAIFRGLAFGSALIAVDCTGEHVQGYAILVDEDPEHPWICWAWVSATLQNAGLARDMVQLLIANYVACAGSRPVRFCSATGADHAKAANALQKMGFKSGELVSVGKGGADLAESPTMLWRLPYNDLTTVLEEALRLSNVVYRYNQATGRSVRIIFSEPVTTDRLLQQELEALIRARKLRRS